MWLCTHQFVVHMNCCTHIILFHQWIYLYQWFWYPERVLQTILMGVRLLSLPVCILHSNFVSVWLLLFSFASICYGSWKSLILPCQSLLLMLCLFSVLACFMNCFALLSHYPPACSHFCKLLQRYLLIHILCSSSHMPEIYGIHAQCHSICSFSGVCWSIPLCVCVIFMLTRFLYNFRFFAFLGYI